MRELESKKAESFDVIQTLLCVRARMVYERVFVYIYMKQQVWFVLTLLSMVVERRMMCGMLMIGNRVACGPHQSSERLVAIASMGEWHVPGSLVWPSARTDFSLRVLSGRHETAGVSGMSRRFRVKARTWHAHGAISGRER